MGRELKILQESLKSKKIDFTKPNFKLMVREAKKFKTDEQFLRAGGFSTEALDKAAFGFYAEEITTLDPKQLHIKWTDDLDGVKYEQNYSGKSKKEWALTIDLSEPIDVIFENGKFFIDDGHHRYYAASILKKKLNTSLIIHDRPIEKLAGTKQYDYDQFVRDCWETIVNG
jgi:hypothetical protein